MNKLAILGVFAAMSMPMMAQQPQIPTLQVCNNVASSVSVISSGAPLINIPSRVSGGFTGNVTVNVNAGCNANTGFPTGSVTLSGLSMNDPFPGGFVGSISSVLIDQITSTGTENPTAYMSGQCMAQTVSTPGTVTLTPCHFWILFADTAGPNTSAPNGGQYIVSFLVFDKTGKRIAYATGQVTSGSGTIQVTPTAN
jgi:hypothetical protein